MVGGVDDHDRVIRRVVGAFNGGWQTVHGQFGMCAQKNAVFVLGGEPC